MPARSSSSASEELPQALEELRDLARGLHPAILTERGLGTCAPGARRPLAPAGRRSTNEIDGRLPAAGRGRRLLRRLRVADQRREVRGGVEGPVRAACSDGVVAIEVEDDGVGGADVTGGSGLRGLADRIDALGGSFGVESAPGWGTRVWAEIPVSPEPGDEID